MPKKVTITKAVDPDDYAAGDRAVLYGDSGSGTLDRTAPLSAEFELHPAHGPDPLTLEATVQVELCGTYKFVLDGKDACPNLTQGEELSVVVHTAPPQPAGVRFNSYDAGAQAVLLDVLPAASFSSRARGVSP